MFQAPTNPFEGSPLSSFLSTPPRTVAPPEPPPPPEPEVTEQQTAPTQPNSLLSSVFGGNTATPEPERLTADEIRARAEVQTRTYGAVILLVNALIECVKVSMTLKKGEYAAYLELKSNLATDGVVNVYESDPAVKEIWLKGKQFDETLEAIEEETELEDAEAKMLFKAIKADLERKNQRNEVNDDSISGIMFKLMLTRQLTNFSGLITTFTRRSAQR